MEIKFRHQSSSTNLKCARQVLCHLVVVHIMVSGLIQSCSGLELEYFNFVKSTFDVPASKSVQNEQRSHRTENGTLSPEDAPQVSMTAFGLTLVVVSIIGIVLIVVITYICYYFISCVIGFILRQREKRRKTSFFESGVDTETETSSLDSNLGD